MDAINLRNFIPPKAERILEFGFHNAEYALLESNGHEVKYVKSGWPAKNVHVD